MSAARTDTERLDWLEAVNDGVEWQRRSVTDTEPLVVLFWFAGDGDERTSTKGATWREAIDKALALRDRPEGAHDG